MNHIAKTVVSVICLGAVLVFSNLQSSEPSLPKNSPLIKVALSNQEFNLLGENYRRVTLTKSDGNPIFQPARGSGPSNFPTSAPYDYGGRPRRPVSVVSPYRIPPGVINQGAGCGDGGGDNPYFDRAKAAEKQNLDKINSEDPSFYADKKKSKKSAEQCELDENSKVKRVEVIFRIKKNPALAREARVAGKDQAAQRSLNNLVKQLFLENKNPGIGTKKLFKDIYELRGKNSARVYYREVEGRIEILSKSVKTN